MKQETNNEMDLLLRRLGRRNEPAAADDHLDADELSAFAENALPARARARYTAHLAECASCRTLVVQLSSSANVVASTDSVAVAELSGFRRFLASLFTPMVLRYAVPALGLIVVAAIGFVVLRREQADRYVAQETNTQQHPAAAPAAKSPELTHEDNTVQYSINAPSPGQVNTAEQEKKQTAPAVAPPPNAPPTVTSVETEVAKDKAVAQPQREEQKAAANEPPPAKPEPTATPDQSPRAAEPDVARTETKVQAAGATETAGKDVRGARRDDDRGNSNFTRARRPSTTLGSVAGVQGRGDTDLSANTRVVAGRRFQRKGGVWIDTAYDSSKDVMTLSRGSEQYRALVADEPEIKTIADQLEGEIIVVWKTRTYRIH
jgi:outer membrane biosynthesis protein TonB